MEDYKAGGEKGNSNLFATNRLFKKSPLFRKRKKKAPGVYDPKAKYRFDKGGALLTKKVTCKKCGWEWDAADGGDDITTCHKCGGQGLMHAKNGGLNKFVGGGQPCPEGFQEDPVTGDCVVITERTQDIQEVSINQYSPYISKYEESNPRDAYVYQKKADYLNKYKGLNKQAGLSQDNFNTDVEGNFNSNWEYDKNSEVIKQFAKDHGINPKNHVELVEKMADKGNVSYDMIANSKYGSKLQPSLWARSLAGAQELGNFVVKQLPGEQGDVFNKQIKGLTKKEWDEIHNSGTGALETLAVTDLPGAVIANSVADLSTASGGNFQESPGLLSGELKSNVDPTAAALLNPFLYAGLGQGIVSAPKIAANASNLMSKGLTGGKKIVTSIDNAVYPTRTYRASLPGGNEALYEASDLSKKVFNKGDFTTKNLDEARQYLAGSEATNRKGLLTGQDMNLTEYKVPFWKKDISFDPDVVALKNSQGVDINTSEYIIPNNKFLYPRKTTQIKAVPEELKVFNPEQLSSGDLPYYPSSIPVGPASDQFASKPWKYIEDQINAVTGHDMPLTWNYDPSLGPNQNIPLHNWKQPQIPQNKYGGLHKFIDGGPTDCGEGMVWSDELQDCVREQAIHNVKINQYTPYVNAWNEMHPEQREVEQKKAEFLRKAKGLNKTFGVNADNFPQNVLDNIYKTIDRERNNYVITQYAKDKGFNPNKHVDLVENIAEKGSFGYDMAQNSKYGSKLAPSLWARSLAGVQELGNFVVKQLPGEQGDVFKYKVPGLSKKERKEIADSETGALQTASILNLPGQIIANQVAKYVKPIFGGTGADSRDQEDTPGVLSGQYIPGVDDRAATLLNPLTYTGLVSGLSNIGNIANATNSVLTTGANLTTKASQALAPFLGAEIAGVPGLTAGNALTAYSIGKAGKNATGNIIEGNYGQAGYDAAKGLLTALPLTKFGNPELYPVLNNWRSGLSFGTTGIDASLNPTAFNDFNTIRKAPNDWKSPLSLPSSAPTVFSKVTDKINQLGKIKKRGGELNKYEEEGMVLDLSPEEIEEYRKGGYVIEDISVPSLSHMVNGGQPCPEGYEWDEAVRDCFKINPDVYDILYPVTKTPVSAEYASENPNVMPYVLNLPEAQAGLPDWVTDNKKFGKDNINWYQAWNPKKWGLNDYSEYSSYNSAFRNARKSKEPEFVYKGKRYTTLLEEDKLEQNKKYKEALDYTEAYMQSPKYKEMLKRSSDSEKEYKDISKERYLNLKSIPSLKIISQQPEDKPYTRAYSSNTNGQITMLPEGFDATGTLLHEISHSVDRPDWIFGNRNIPESDRDYINKHKAKSLLESRNYKKNSSWTNKDFETKDEEFKEYYTDYVGEDTETRARLNAIRENSKKNNLYDPFTEGVSPELYHNKLKNFRFDKGRNNPMNQLKGTYSDEEIIWMLNNISKNENEQEEGIEEGVGKKGGAIETNISKLEIKKLIAQGYVIEEI
jgi:hypothetical protein